MEAKNNNDATLIVVDPRLRVPLLWRIFTHLFVPVRTLVPVWRFALPDRKQQNQRRIRKHYTNASLLVRDDFAFEDGRSAATTLKNVNTISRPGTISR